MIEEHFGQIKIENNLTGGACITIALPITLPIENASAKPIEIKNNSKKSVKNAQKANAPAK